MDAKDKKKILSIIESLLFASPEPVPFKKIHSILSLENSLKKEETASMIQHLKHSYETEGRAFDLVEVAFGYQLKTRPQFYPYIQQLVKKKHQDKLTPSAQEVLAIIAFKSSITRSEIEAIRGVDSSSIIHGLLDRGLIKTVGVKEAPGKPDLFGPSEKFFLHFGLKDMEQLKCFLQKNKFF